MWTGMTGWEQGTRESRAESNGLISFWGIPSADLFNINISGFFCLYAIRVVVISIESSNPFRCSTHEAVVLT